MEKLLNALASIMVIVGFGTSMTVCVILFVTVIRGI